MKAYSAAAILTFKVIAYRNTKVGLCIYYHSDNRSYLMLELYLSQHALQDTHNALQWFPQFPAANCEAYRAKAVGTEGHGRFASFSYWPQNVVSAVNRTPF